MVRRGTVGRAIFTNRRKISVLAVINVNHFTSFNRRAVPRRYATASRIGAAQIGNFMNRTLFTQRHGRLIVSHVDIFRQTTNAVRHKVIMFNRSRNRDNRNDRYTERTSSDTNFTYEGHFRHFVSVLISINGNLLGLHFNEQVILRITFNRARQTGIRKRHNLRLHIQVTCTVTTGRRFHETTARVGRRVQDFSITAGRTHNAGRT